MECRAVREKSQDAMSTRIRDVLAPAFQGTRVARQPETRTAAAASDARQAGSFAWRSSVGMSGGPFSPNFRYPDAPLPLFLTHRRFPRPAPEREALRLSTYPYWRENV